MAAFIRRGLKVAPFKVGPDFIDPGHHSRITATTSRNLDGWMLSRHYNEDTFVRCSQNADIAVVEGVMGLYDGYDGKSDAGSTAHMAKWLGLPVVLLVDAKSMARSAAAVVMGFEHFDRDLTFAGVIFNHLGSSRHLKYLADAVSGRVTMPCLGGIGFNAELVIPERHLGLVTREDHPLSKENMHQLADAIEDSLDLDALLRQLPEIVLPKVKASTAVVKSVKIGIARDKAFCFYYLDNLELLERSGAELTYFSPMGDEKLPPDIDGLYLGGGYPELYAQQLVDNTLLRKQIKQKSSEGMPIYGECGGFMYLCQELWDQHGKRYPMTGCFPFVSKMFSRLKALGYREISLTRDTILGGSGLKIRGHEFHYSGLTQTAGDIQTVYRIADRAGMDKSPEGYCIHNTLGSYNHLHFGSQPAAAECFVENSRGYRHRRGKTYEA
jgi:cobyrinic acid a,c-diamide synthase